MKKLYTLLFTTLVALSSASAATFTPRVENQREYRLLTADELVARKTTLSADITALKPSRATTNVLGGEYNLTVGDWYDEEGSGLVTLDCDVFLNDTKTKAQLYCPSLPSNPEATYSTSTNKLTFTRIPWENPITIKDAQGASVNAYVRLEPFAYNTETEEIKRKQTLPVNYNPETNSVTFDANTGLCWAVYSTAILSSNSFLGYLCVVDLISLTPYAPDPNRNDGWTSLGNATLMDGWLLPCFNINQLDESNWYKVELQQNNDNKNIYRLVNPYHGNSPAAKYNETARTGYIQFDVTDPDHVTFAPVAAGFQNHEQGIYNFYCNNYISCAMATYDMTLEEVIEKAPNLPGTTFKNGVVTLGSFKFTPTGSTETVTDYDARFGVNFEPYAGYTWVDDVDDSIALDMNTKIIFPAPAGVDDVTVDSTDAPTEYYNLQGIRVDNPVPGTLYITKTGNKVVKLIK